MISGHFKWGLFGALCLCLSGCSMVSSQWQVDQITYTLSGSGTNGGKAVGIMDLASWETGGGWTVGGAVAVTERRKCAGKE